MRLICELLAIALLITVTGTAVSRSTSDYAGGGHPHLTTSLLQVQVRSTEISYHRSIVSSGVPKILQAS